MIESAKITTGYASKLPALADKTFRFHPGVNVLFGQNGCGKTSLLHIIAAHCSIDPKAGGQPKFLEPLRQRKKSYEESLSDLAPGKCQAELGWDGSFAFLHSASMASRPIAYFGEETDGLITETERVSITMFGGASAGQHQLMNINRLCSMLRKLPDHTALPKECGHVNDVWQDAINKYIRWVMAKPRTGPPTLLLDEPDRSLSLTHQYELWQMLLRTHRAAGVQIIASTHSPFAFLMPPETIIDMSSGYLVEGQLALMKLFEESVYFKKSEE